MNIISYKSACKLFTCAAKIRVYIILFYINLIAKLVHKMHSLTVCKLGLYVFLFENAQV